MASRLVPCHSCSRHVKLGPPSCPFCGSSVPADAPPRVTSLAGRPLTRAAIALASVGVASSCSNSSQTGEVLPAYGVVAIPVDAAADAGGDAGADAGQFTTHYGVAVLPDAGDTGVPDGGTAALYGPAILPDAGLGDAPGGASGDGGTG